MIKKSRLYRKISNMQYDVNTKRNRIRDMYKQNTIDSEKVLKLHLNCLYTEEKIKKLFSLFKIWSKS